MLEREKKIRGYQFLGQYYLLHCVILNLCKEIYLNKFKNVKYFLLDG